MLIAGLHHGAPDRRRGEALDCMLIAGLHHGAPDRRRGEALDCMLIRDIRVEREDCVWVSLIVTDCL